MESRAANPSVKAPLPGIAPAHSWAIATKDQGIAADAGTLRAKAWAGTATAWAGAGARRTEFVRRS